jgi:hypothetical protein
MGWINFLNLNVRCLHPGKRKSGGEGSYKDGKASPASLVLPVHLFLFARNQDSADRDFGGDFPLAGLKLSADQPL